MTTLSELAESVAVAIALQVEAEAEIVVMEQTRKVWEAIIVGMVNAYIIEHQLNPSALG